MWLFRFFFHCSTGLTGCRTVRYLKNWIPCTPRQHPAGYTADSEEKYIMHVHTGGSREGLGSQSQFPHSCGLWAIYIFPQSVCLFCWRKYVDRSWDCTNRSHDRGNWGWGRAIPRKGIHKRDFRCSVCPIVLWISSSVWPRPLILWFFLIFGGWGRGHSFWIFISYTQVQYGGWWGADLHTIVRLGFACGLSAGSGLEAWMHWSCIDEIGIGFKSADEFYPSPPLGVNSADTTQLPGKKKNFNGQFQYFQITQPGSSTVTPLYQ
jgi:hypothetical protein